jgi:hypothetical protein
VVLQAVRGAVVKRLEWLDSNFLAAVNAFLTVPGVRSNPELAALLGAVRQETLQLVSEGFGAMSWEQGAVAVPLVMEQGVRWGCFWYTPPEGGVMVCGAQLRQCCRALSNLHLKKWLIQSVVAGRKGCAAPLTWRCCWARCAVEHCSWRVDSSAATTRDINNQSLRLQVAQARL